MGTYEMIVIFQRNREDDEAVYGKEDADLMRGLADELQEAYDELALSGHFQVQCIIQKI